MLVSITAILDALCEVLKTWSWAQWHARVTQEMLCSLQT